MNDTWIYKADGTLQCNNEMDGIPLSVMADSLTSIIGKSGILSQRKLRLITMQRCETPTGSINAFELTPEAFDLWKRGISGKLGFELLDPANLADDTETGLPFSFADIAEPRPQYIGELVGHPLRVYKTGEMITMDLRPSRCNIETSKSGDGQIVRIWFG